MIPIVDPGIESYAEAHTTAPEPHLTALADETRERMQAHVMMVGTLEGRFLELLVFALRPKLVLEIGTFTGYSSLAMCAGLPEGGRIITCDVDPEAVEIAQRHHASSPHAGRVEFRLGPALETIAALDGPFDFVFIDADKTSYRDYYEAVLPKLSAGAVIAVDNVLWSGRVVDDSADDADTRAIKAFNDHVVSDERVVCAMATVRDGVTLIRKR